MANAVAETTSAVQASGRTGAACTASGPYRSDRNNRIVVFVPAGAKFPPDGDGTSTVWTLVSEVTAERAAAGE